MDSNGRSVWHAGGTRAPLLVKRGGPAAGIWHRRATGVVPLRATGGALSWMRKDPVRAVFHASGARQWHGVARPPASSPLKVTGGHDEHDQGDRDRGSEAGGVGEPSEAPLRPLAGPLPRTGRWDLHGSHGGRQAADVPHQDRCAHVARGHAYEDRPRGVGAAFDGCGAPPSGSRCREGAVDRILRVRQAVDRD